MNDLIEDIPSDDSNGTDLPDNSPIETLDLPLENDSGNTMLGDLPENVPDDIPEDDVQVYDAPKAEAPVKKTNVVTETKMENKEAPAPANDDIPDDELNDLASDTDDLPVADPAPAPTAAKPTNDVSDDEINALIDGI